MIDNYKKIKKLGSGGQGVVYLVMKNSNKFALKIDHIIDSDIHKNLKSYIWRDIEFSNYMFNKYPNHFIKLIEYDFIDNCKNKYKIKIPIDNLTQQINEINNCNLCSRRIYQYVDYTLDKIIDKINIQQVYSIIIQLAYIIYIMHNEGYVHGDLHEYNIGIIITKKKYITILNYKVKTFGYIVKLIDYGRVLHKKYILKMTDFNVHEKVLLKNDMINEIKRINFIVTTFPIYKNLPMSVWKKWDNIMNQFIMSNEYNYIKSLIPNITDNNELYNLYLLIYPEKAQKQILKKNYIKVIPSKLRIPLCNYIFLITNNNPVKIIEYFYNILL